MTRKALVVGIQYYPNFYGKGRHHDLQNPPRDAEKIAQLLEKYGRFEVTRLPVTVAEGGYQVNEVGVVNARTLRDAIYELFVEPRDGKLPQTALLFFAGHGLSRSEYGEMVGYLGTSDNNPEREKWGVEFSWIAKQLINSQVPEQVIWLDCCHSGKFTQELFTQADFKNQSRKDVQRSFIAACRDSETAYGVEGHGVLSHLLLKVLQPNYHASKHWINNLDIEAAVEREFQQHPQFKTYPQRPVFFHLGDRPIYFWEGRNTQESVNANAASSRQLSKQEYRNRQALLSQMRTEVDSRLAQSLHHAVLLNLGKEQQPQQVQRSWDISVKVGEQRSFQLPSETSILEVFENSAMSGKFLILGKPGGGKTTTLLELAQALVERAETDSDAPIPIILELSAWRTVTKGWFWNKKEYDPSIKEWILSQLQSKGVSQKIGEQWIRDKELVLLLDGLDELPSERQAKCVRAINQFLDGEFSPRHLVVCSRKEEYENYAEVLHLNGAICLEDLTVEQMRHYFVSVNLGEFWESIKNSEKIVNFIRQPLFLAITSIAYQQIDVAEWINCNTEQRAIDYLLGIYRILAVVKVHNNHLNNNAIIWLAKYLQDSENKEFIVKTLRPTTLLSSEPFYRKIGNISEISIFFLIFFAIFVFLQHCYSALLDSLLVWSNSGLENIWFIYFLFFFNISLLGLFHTGTSMIFSIFATLDIEGRKILLVNKFDFLTFSGFYTFLDSFLKTLISSIILAMTILAILLPFLAVLMSGQSQDLLSFLELVKSIIFGGFFIALYSAIILTPIFMSPSHDKTTNKAKTNQSRELNYVLLIANFILWTIFCFFFYKLVTLSLTTIINLPYFSSWIAPFPLVMAAYVGVFWGGGYGLWKHFIVRFSLFKYGYLPWNITRFLDYCTERLILQRVGNRYRFIHRLVQEHFANLEIQKK